MTLAERESIELVGRKFDWPSLLNEALEVEGVVGRQYSAFHRYSFMNSLLLYMQMEGRPEPVASYNRWRALGRQVMRGSNGMVIVRPITVKREDAEGNEVSFMRFKPVRGAFSYSQTEGDPLPEPEVPEWSIDRALETLGIERVPFDHIDGNVQGYSFERKLAINPVARWAGKTAVHETAHIEHGHTAEGQQADYVQHRGAKEFEAEGTALLVLREVGLSTPEQEAESRGYVQSWMRGEKPTDRSVRRIFKVADAIIRAGEVVAEDGLVNEGGI